MVALISAPFRFLNNLTSGRMRRREGLSLHIEAYRGGRLLFGSALPGSDRPESPSMDATGQ